MSKTNLYQTRGYTLIEIMIALSVFAILATLTSASIYNAFNTHKRLNTQSEKLNTLQLAITMIERDVVQATPREIRGEEMHVIAPFIGKKFNFEFTRNGFVNPASLNKRSTLQRIAYLCQDNQLIRRAWPALDTPARNEYQDMLLLSNLEACSFEYLSQRQQFTLLWPEKSQNKQNKRIYPKAIQMNITLSEWGNANFLMIIPAGLYGS